MRPKCPLLLSGARGGNLGRAVTVAIGGVFGGIAALL
jgi:hypothetical protein